MGIVFMAGAGVGVVAGLTFLLVDLSTASYESPRATTPRVVPVIGFNSVGLAGTF
jgi:hypothetical protein